MVYSTPIPADGDSMIFAVEELLREVLTPDLQVKASPPPSEHGSQNVQLNRVNQRSFTAEEKSQQICHGDAQVTTIRSHSELNDEQFSKFLPFFETGEQPTPEVFPARYRCLCAVIEANSVMPCSEAYRQWLYDRFKDTVVREAGNTWDKSYKSSAAHGCEDICRLQPI